MKKSNKKLKNRKTSTELPINQIICNHNIRAMRRFPNNSIDSIITDPPYEISFMSKNWDNKGISFSIRLWKVCLRVAKP